MTTRPDELFDAAAASDLRVLVAHLSGLDDASRRQAAQWFAGTSNRWTRRSRPVRLVRGVAGPDGLEDPSLTSRLNAVVDACCAVALLPPAQAARRVTFDDALAVPRRRRPDRVDATPALAALAAVRGTAWTARFVAAAAGRRLSDREREDPRTLYGVLRAVADSAGVELPLTDAVVEGWVLTRPSVAGPLVMRMRNDSLVPAVLAPALANEATHLLTGLPAALAALAAEGVVDRGELVATCLEHLVGPPQRPSAQGVQVAVLAALGTTTAELGGGPLLRGLLAACDGAVGAFVLPHALALADGPELVLLAQTVAGRREKAQKTVLLAHLAADATRDRHGAAVVVDALRALRDGELDAALTRGVDRALAAAGSRPEHRPVSATGLWDAEPPVVVRPVRPVADLVRELRTPGDVAAAASRVASGWTDDDPGDLVAPDAALAALVGWSLAEGPEAVRAAMSAPVRRWRGGVGTERRAVLDALQRWVDGKLDRSWLESSVRSARADSRPDLPGGGPSGRTDPGTHLRHLHAAEVLLRLGTADRLLSTPTTSDGVLTWADLVARLRTAGSGGYGPIDLLLALLSLEPVDPSALDALDGVHLLADPGVSSRGDVPDAVTVVRAWVLEGRPGHRLRLRPSHPARRWEVDPSGVPRAVRVLTAAPDRYWRQDGPLPAAVARLSPQDPDLLVSAACRDRGDPWVEEPVLRLLAASPGTPGPACHDLLLGLLVGTRPATRAGGVGYAVELAGRGRLDPDLLVAAALDRQAHGELPLARFAAAWEMVAIGGGLRATWAPVLRVAAALAAAPRLPVGLAELLRALARYAVEVPDPVLPPEVLALAAAKGSTKAHHEARALVAAVAR